MEMDRAWSMRIVLIIGILSILIVLLTWDCTAKTMTVDDDGGSDHTSIQDAINASSDGDTIVVLEGQYREIIVVNRSVTLMAVGNASIMHEERKVLVTITSEHVVFEGFTIYHSGAGEFSSKGMLVYGQDVTVANNTVYNHNEGISIRSSNSRVHNNSVFGNMYGIYVSGDDAMCIENNTCTRNKASGIMVIGSDENLIQWNTCSDNERSGITVCCLSYRNSIRNNTCDNNPDAGIGGEGNSHYSQILGNSLSHNGAGIRINSDTFFTLQENTLTGNGIVIEPSSIHGNGSSIRFWITHTIDDTNIVDGKPVFYAVDRDHFTVPTDVSQIIIANCSNVLIQDLSLSNVSAGIILAYSTNITIRNCTISSTTISGISTIDVTYLLIENVTFHNNKGKGLWIRFYFDHVYYFTEKCVEINNCTFENIGDQALYLDDADNTVVRDCVFSESTNEVITVFLSSNLTLERNALFGKGLKFYGVVTDWSTHTITDDNTFHGDPILYYADMEFVKISTNAGQIILANCSNSSVEDIDSPNLRSIQIGFSKDIRVVNNSLSQDEAVIDLYASWKCDIWNNTLSGDGSEIILTHAQDCVIRWNSMMNGSNGIHVIYSQRNEIHGNQLEYCLENGISISNSYTNEIRNNTIMQAGTNGIHISESSNSATISGNMITGGPSPVNTKNGILISSGYMISLNNNTISDCHTGVNIDSYLSYGEVTNNTITHNTFGIFIHLSFGTLIRNNSFTGNELFGICTSAMLNDSTEKIDATNNWWGNKTGPYHPVKNPMGLGDNITASVLFDPWTGKSWILEADFFVSHYFNTTLEINDTNDVLVNDRIDLFFGDGVKFIENVFPQDSDSMTYNWTFRCLDTGFTMFEQGNQVFGSVGEDFLFEGFNGTLPIKSESYRDFEVTLRVSDGNATSEHSILIRVHPLATGTWVERFRIDENILEATVTLTWRGFPNEAAPLSEYISETRPVFVSINASAVSPDPLLKARGGVGKVFDISAVGCFLQNGDPGFIKAEISLPFLTSELEAMGDFFSLIDYVHVEYYDNIEKRFIHEHSGYVIQQGEVNYAVIEVHHFSGIYTTIVDASWISPKAEFSVVGVELSHEAAIVGQVVEVRVTIENSGVVNGRNVDVRIYDGDSMIGEQRIERIRAAGGVVQVNISFIATLLNSNQSSEDHSIIVNVNWNHIIQESSYTNNLGTAEFTVIAEPMKEKEEDADEGESLIRVLLVSFAILIGILGYYKLMLQGTFQRMRESGKEK